MAKSKTKIDRQARRKLNPELFETIIKAKKNEKWLETACMLSMPRRKRISVNLDEIDRESKEGDTIVVAGKVLGEGDVSKRIRIAALAFSDEARKKLKSRKCEIATLLEEINKNPKAQGVRLWQKK